MSSNGWIVYFWQILIVIYAKMCIHFKIEYFYPRGWEGNHAVILIGWQQECEKYSPHFVKYRRYYSKIDNHVGNLKVRVNILVK